MALNLDRIAENERKITKLDDVIKRTTAKKKKLMEENARLTYMSLCEQYNSSGLELIELLTRKQTASEDKAVPKKLDVAASSADKSKNVDSEDNKDQLSFYN